MILINYKDTRPIYEQIVERFQTLILKGAIEPDSKMPSVRNLAMELSINPNTIQKAYSELERRGFIYTIKGRGNFVSYSKDLLLFRKEELLGVLDEIIKEANEIGISMDEILSYIRSKEKKHD